MLDLSLCPPIFFVRRLFLCAIVESFPFKTFQFHLYVYVYFNSLKTSVHSTFLNETIDFRDCPNDLRENSFKYKLILRFIGFEVTNIEN